PLRTLDLLSFPTRRSSDLRSHARLTQPESWRGRPVPTTLPTAAAAVPRRATSLEGSAAPRKEREKAASRRLEQSTRHGADRWSPDRKSTRLNSSHSQSSYA